MFHTSFRVAHLFCLSILLSCSQSPQIEPTSVSQTNHYISAITSGEISAHGEIGITLAEEVAPEKQLTRALLTFSPSVDGNIEWVNNRTLVFTPNRPLKNGTSYRASLDLAQLFPGDEPSNTYQFTVTTIPQDLELSLGALSPSTENRDMLELEGSVFTADLADLVSIKKSVRANLDGSPLEIEWLSDGLQKTHRFFLPSIERSSESATLKILWSGNAIGASANGMATINVPPKGAFELIESNIFRDENPRIELIFSDNVKNAQNFTGLITLGEGNPVNVITNNNIVIVYPRRRVNGSQTLIIDSTLKSSSDKPLGIILRRTVNFFQPKPTIQFLGKGTILPRSNDLFMPFKAVSLGAVDVQISRIFENNIGQFLQDQQMNGTNTWNLRRVARPVFQGEVPLSSLGNVDAGEWNNYALDLSNFIEPEPGAIYQLEIGFRQHQAMYPCGENSDSESTNTAQTLEFDSTSDTRYWNSFGDYYRPRNFNWRERDNPCSSSYYYSNRRIRKNVFASDLGLIAKTDAQNATTVFVTDLRTTEPLPGVNVQLFNYQQQPFANGVSDSEGKVVLEADQTAYYIVAEQGDQKGYLRTDDGSSLSLSNFDVSGARVQKGIKGFMYGERGVWRPGDSLFVTLLLEDKNNVLPDDHPIIFELRDPSGQIIDRQTQLNNPSGFFVYHSITDKQAPTGNWRLSALVGGQTFSKTLKIETVKPNRLKVDLDFENEAVYANNRTLDATLSSQWLHGATARNLKADVEMMLRPSPPVFDNYRDYSFTDETISFDAKPEFIFDGALRADGTVDFTHTFPAVEKAPSRFRADFNLRVFEPSGSFSIGRASTFVYPYRTLVGIKAPEGNARRYGNWLNRSETHAFEIATIDAEGTPVGGRNLEFEVYHIRWRWWWERAREDLSNYFERENVRKVASGTFQTRSVGKNILEFKLPNNADGGRYLIRVKDPRGNHSASTIVYFSWGSGRSNAVSPAQLSFSSDKEEYETGEQVTLTIPSSANSRLLLSLETGSKILETIWLDGNAGETKYTFTTDERMSPNVYAHVMHIQPHGQTDNDLPLRMYGVIPISVFNPETVLEPQLSMPDELKPETTTTIQVSEVEGKPMSYTLAIVDDGLLDLTNFSTPDPHPNFYAREALGIKTWDLYEFVTSGFSGSVSRVLSVGGDGEALAADPLNEANRFKPMVRFEGPFHLEAGATQSHIISIPNYVGSVRTMIVAGRNGSYGSAQKTTPVRKPVMVLATLPRVLGPAEDVELPISVFAMKESIKKVDITIQTNAFFEETDETEQTIRFEEPGDEVVTFSLKTKAAIGVGKVRVEARSGRETAYHEIEIAIRNPNQPFTQVLAENLDAGATWQLPLELQGMTGTNTATLELSRIPPINVSKRLKYLIRYPHGCIEQTTSAVFAQMLASDVVELDAEQKKTIQLNVEEGIERINKFLTPGGGLGYWPGSENANSWGTTYAYHFLLEAQKRGYYVPSALLSSINAYQNRIARRWTTTEYRRSDLQQAYRLYTLALAGTPELGAMNRFRERSNLSAQARWRIAATYSLIGQPEAANNIVQGATTSVEEYQELSGSFGSSLRDQAMILETLALLNRQDEATDLMRTIATSLSTNNWYSTQTTAYSLIAISKYLNSYDVAGEIDATYELNSGDVGSISSNAFVRQLPLTIDEQAENTISVTNNSSGTLFARVILEGTPLIGDNISTSSNLVQRVRYLTLNGEPVDPESLEQGSDIVMEIAVQNPGLRGNYQELALTAIFPSGWELRNTRMDGEAFKEPVSNFEYQDIRDDRVYTYFDLSANSTKVFRFQLNASYQGRFYLPAVKTSAMYDETINARSPGQWITIEAPGN
jgi:uncharacterized protein YfaS (alpha-2-macroglobulin family)